MYLVFVYCTTSIGQHITRSGSLESCQSRLSSDKHRTAIRAELTNFQENIYSIYYECIILNMLIIGTGWPTVGTGPPTVGTEHPTIFNCQDILNLTIVGTGCPTVGTGCLTVGTGHPTVGTGHLPLGTGYPTVGTWLTSDCRDRTSDCRDRMSDFRNLQLLGQDVWF